MVDAGVTYDTGVEPLAELGFVVHRTANCVGQCKSRFTVLEGLRTPQSVTEDDRRWKQPIHAGRPRNAALHRVSTLTRAPSS